MIDALFGSKTRVKLLHLFFNNPDKSFYVREITRLIDEQINSVRRELSNMLNVGVITSDSSDNKLYYKVDRDYEYYEPFRLIFSDDVENIGKQLYVENNDWREDVKKNPSIRLVIASGILVPGSASAVDMLFVGNIDSADIKNIISKVEQDVNRELNYSVMNFDDFYYRMSVRDKFITEIMSGAHDVVVDLDNVLKEE